METGYSRSTRPESKTTHKLRLQLLRAQVGKEEANRKLRELELERQTENLVPIAEAKEAIRKVLEPLRSLLDALPKAAAHPAELHVTFVTRAYDTEWVQIISGSCPQEPE